MRPRTPGTGGSTGDAAAEPLACGLRPRPALVPFSVGRFRRQTLGHADGRPNVMLTPPQAAGSIWPEICEVPPNSDDRSMTSQILRGGAPQNDDAWRRETLQPKTALRSGGGAAWLHGGRRGRSSGGHGLSTHGMTTRNLRLRGSREVVAPGSKAPAVVATGTKGLPFEREMPFNSRRASPAPAPRSPLPAPSFGRRRGDGPR
jgi:hypothetical protein